MKLAIIALAAILSLSLFAHTYAVEENDDNKKPTVKKSTEEKNGCCGRIFKDDKGNALVGEVIDPLPPTKKKITGNDHHHNEAASNVNHKIKHKVNEINSLFRSNDDNTAAPVATLQGFNATFHDASTPYCWYVVNAHPCFDTRTGTLR